MLESGSQQSQGIDSVHVEIYTACVYIFLAWEFLETQIYCDSLIFLFHFIEFIHYLWFKKTKTLKVVYEKNKTIQ